MTIASEITKLNTNLTNAYTAVDSKGGTLPQAQNFDNLATAISSIPSGGGSFIGIPREVKNGVYQVPTENFTFSLPNDVTSISNYGLAYAFYGSSGLTSADLSSLTSVGNYGMNSTFSSCSGLTSADLSALTSVGNSGLYGAFNGCTGLTSVDLSSLASVGNYGMNSTFSSCLGLTSIYFNALKTTSFGSYVNQFQYMFNSLSMITSGNCTMHFPSNLQTKISGLTGYPNFGATSGRLTLAFDLPATS